MAVALGILVALTYGSGDFFGGLASKRTAAATAVAGSFALSAILLLLATGGWWLVGGLPSPVSHDLVLGVATGFVGPVALGLLYYGLATGRMSVVAPITAVVAAVVPFTWGLVHGERPSAVAIAGAVVAIIAVVAISGAPTADDGATTASDASRRLVVPLAFASGLGFGVIFVLLGSTSHHAGLWPLLVAWVVSVLLVITTFAVVGRRRPTNLRDQVVPRREAWALVATSGVLDITANALYLAAIHRGLISIVAVLSSLYPASTVLLARVVLHERLHRVQLVGLLLAALGVAAMSAG